MPLKNIAFSFYKRFKDEEKIEIRPVTVLVGKNSSGKSSICKLFPMLANSMTPFNIISPFLFDNNGVCLGTSFSDISHNGEAVGLSFELDYTSGLDIKVELFSEDLNQSFMVGKYFLRKHNEEYELTFDKRNNYYNTNFQREPYQMQELLGFYCEELFKKAGVSDDEIDIDVDYIGPFRVIPQRVYYSKGFEILGKVGVLGENAYNELYTNPDLEDLVSEWYEENFGVSLSVDWINDIKGAYQINMINNIKPFMIKLKILLNQKIKLKLLQKK